MHDLNAVEVLQKSMDFLMSLLGPIPTRLLLGVLAALLVISLLFAIRQRRIGMLRSTFLIVLAALFTGLAWNPNLMLELNQIGFLTRIRLLMGALALVVLLITVEGIRHNLLEERYALLWVFTSLTLILCAIFVRVLDFFCALLGMQYVTFVVAVIFTFLLLVCFHFSVALSQLTNDRTQLAQRCALLENAIEQLERQRQTEHK